MKIGGIQNLTLIDYPGEVAATVFVNGCNLKCPFCHNPDLVYGNNTFISTEQVLAHIKSRKDFYSGICISGGEPTIYGDKLLKLICDIKNLGLKVKLDTNGINTDILKEIIKSKLVDYIAMDIKSIPSLFNKAMGVFVDSGVIKSSLRAITTGDIRYEIRSTIVPDLFPLDKLDELFEFLSGVKAYCIQQFNNQTDLIDNGYKNIIPYAKADLEFIRDHAKKTIAEVVLRQ
jgi:pyruvate formate lyase activating enzyme